MPTQRPRHTITETPEIEAALDAAAAQWPSDRDARGRLLARLVHQGHLSIAGDADAAEAQRLKAVKETAGALTGVYPPGYLERERDGWPE